MSASAAARGATLPELLVVLVLLGVIGVVAGLAVRPGGPPDAGAEPGAELVAARRAALAAGRAVSITVVIDGRVAEGTAWPDGRVLADSAFAFEPLSGRRRASR